MKKFLVSALLISQTAFAGTEVVGGRLSALGLSKSLLVAAIDAIQDPSVMIRKVYLLGGSKVKVELILPGSQACSALVFDLVSDRTGAQYKAVNPQRALCD